MTFIWLLLGLVFGAAMAALALRPRLVAMRAELVHQRAASEARVQAIAEANQQLTDTFRALSADALQSNNRQFLELARESLGRFQVEAKGELEKREKAVEQLVAPIRESLTKVDGQLERLDRDRVRTQSTLQEQLRTLAESQDKLRGQTGALVAALRQPHVRGRWGELQLRRVVEMAGMLAHCDFTEQTTVSSDGQTLRPDLVVNMPGGKHVVVDAKAPLTAFLDAHEAHDDEARRAHLQTHARLLREHIRKLSAKSYWAQFESAPDFVFLFLPGEHFLNAALEADPSLIEQGVSQSVLIATPTTLIALLRAVAYGWQQEKVADSARAVSELGRELHERLAKLADHVQVVGRRLNSTVDAYNAAVGSFEGRVLVSARRLSEHGVVPAGKEIAMVEPIDVHARSVQAAEQAESLPRLVAGGEG
ncbi:MAG: DNA recombination protein RmuC [Gaiellales bacterium]